MEALRAPTSPPHQQTFLNDVIMGLSQQQKQLPSKYFYDDVGSKLFDAICNLPEYYPYRTELNILPKICQEIDQQLHSDYEIVEFGAGSLVKIRLLLDQLEGASHYLPIDIAENHLHQACATLQEDYRSLPITPIVADFTQRVELPATQVRPKLGFFPGSTIGNFTPLEAITFLQNARLSLGPEGLLLIGVDTKKDPTLLHLAYNDSQGVTAAFNQNILARINREIAGDFSVDQFHHYAYYNVQLGRVEMHLVSQKEQQVTIGNKRFWFKQGESIHTENSHKYTAVDFSKLAQQAGWKIQQHWNDNDELFSVFLLAPAAN